LIKSGFVFPVTPKVTPKNIFHPFFLADEKRRPSIEVPPIGCIERGLLGRGPRSKPGALQGLLDHGLDACLRMGLEGLELVVESLLSG